MVGSKITKINGKLWNRYACIHDVLWWMIVDSADVLTTSSTAIVTGWYTTMSQSNSLVIVMERSTCVSLQINKLQLRTYARVFKSIAINKSLQNCFSQTKAYFLRVQIICSQIFAPPDANGKKILVIETQNLVSSQYARVKTVVLIKLEVKCSWNH